MRTYMADRNWLGLPKSRTQQRIDNTLGIIPADKVSKNKKWRDDRLHKLDMYYQGTQYDHLAPWVLEPTQEYIPIHRRKPCINFLFAKRMAGTLASFMWGKKRFPAIKIEADPMTEEYLQTIIRITSLDSTLLQCFKSVIVQGSAFLRISVQAGNFKLEAFEAQYCYPEFDENDELERIEIKYTFKDQSDKKEKWAKIELTKTSDILYDTPEYNSDTEPTFEEVERVEHNLGFVQGEWIRTAIVPQKIDGPSLLEDVLDFIDEINYKLSQTSTAIRYNIDPQLIITGLDQDEISSLVKSSAKGWNLGRDGTANFLESNLGAAQTAVEFVDKIKTNIQNISRILLMDPEKINAQSISGRALEIMHSPLVELIDELRPQQQKHLVNILQKMAVINLALYGQMGASPITIPSGYKPASFDVQIVWPPVFPQTIVDLNEKVNVAVRVSQASLISRETLTRWLAKDFDVQDVEAEIEKIANQPSLNPFGAF